MTAPTIIDAAGVGREVHLAGYELSPGLPLDQQAASVAAELEASEVFLTAARRDLADGDVRALSRIVALGEHQRQLRHKLRGAELRGAEQRHGSNR